MNKVSFMTFASSLTNISELNSSFDSGVLRICYTGKNRNSSFISKEAIERSIHSIYNCPVVCNYDRETDTLGGHDMELVCDDNGGLRIVNITQPVGVIPESGRVWFDTYEEEDGTLNEYLYADVLLWKRQEAYQKIKRDGITAHSMEINIKDGFMNDGVYHINNFEFTAFALIGVEPCFESSALEVFSKQDYKNQLSEMMQDLKESFNLIDTSAEVDDKQTKDISMEGGNKILNDKMELLASYGIDIDSLDFSIEDFTIEELTEKFEAMKNGEGSTTDPVVNSPEEPVVTEPQAVEPTADDTTDFALTGNIVEELARMLESVKIERPWGECTRYWYVDCDFEVNEVYCWDTNDWLLYGFTYSVDGDSFKIDFDSKKRKKYVIEDFNEGEQNSPIVSVFEFIEQKLVDACEFESKYNESTATIQDMESELAQLREFKSECDKAALRVERDEKVFAKFEKLNGNESFEALREACLDYSIEELEEKCFAILGRMGMGANFAFEPKSVKLPVDNTAPAEDRNDPYGGIVERYKKKQ